MRIKEGVSVVDIHPAIRYGILVINEECHKVVGRGPALTSLGESFAHSLQSLHYGVSFNGRKALEVDDRCRAADLDLDEFSQDEKDQIEEGCRARLGRDFDLVIEATHWHLEYDPK